MITYFLGAGASFYSMPLVKDFSKRFELFRKFLMKVPGYDNNIVLQKRIEKFEDEVKFHVSFDTFFKKLFHLQSGNSDNQKAILLLFFIFEHTVKKDDFISYKEEFKIDGDLGQKRGNLDPRYEALIAGLLAPKQKKFELITKVNFITWNYDLNLIYAINNFLSLGEDLFSITKDNPHEISLHEDVKIINLNGLIRHPKLINLNGLAANQHLKLFEQLTYFFTEEPEKLYDYALGINFSWEILSKHNGLIENVDHIKNSQQLVTESDVIIITGYSFPLYNRFVDTAIINSKTIKKQKIYVQDPNADEISSILKTDLNLKASIPDFPIKEEHAKIFEKKDCNSFFVPSSLFGKTP